MNITDDASVKKTFSYVGVTVL